MNLQTYMALQSVVDADYEKLIFVQALTDVDPPKVRFCIATFVRDAEDGGGTLATHTVNYGETPVYPGATPTTTKGDASDYPFEGWTPPLGPITKPTTYHATFGSPEISDDWDTIVANVANGTYKTKYKIGNYKPLDLGSEGVVNMQIVAKDADSLANGSGNAPLTWVSMEHLSSTHRMNPGVVSNYKFESGESFKRNSRYTSNTGYNQWDSQQSYTANNTAKITFTVTAVTDGTLRLKYITGSQSNYTTSLKIDGTEVVSSYSSTAQNYDLAITSGTTYVIVYESTTKNNTASVNTYIKLCDTSNNGNNTKVSALVTQDSVVVDDCTIRLLDYYSAGTGAVGGWENTEMRAYLKDTIKPLIPEAVRSHIKSVTKYTRTINTAGTVVNNVETTEDVWSPSYREIFGGTNLETSGPVYTTVFSDSASRIKKRGGSAAWWWLRSANTKDEFWVVSDKGSSNVVAAYNIGGMALGFCM